MSDAPSATYPQTLEAPKAPPGAAVRFVVTAVVIGLLLFAFFRVPWVKSEVMVPYAKAQQKLAGALLGLERPTVAINFSCTGADVMALCLGTVLAFPAPWRKRLSGAVFGLLLISVVNTARIGSLSLAVGTGSLYQTLHVVVWPAVLVVVVSLYALLWMRSVARARPRAAAPAVPSAPALASATTLPSAADGALFVRFACWLVPLAALYFAGSSWYLQSDWIRAAARLAARTGALLFALFGATASAVGPSLVTAHSSYRVTPLCLASPLVPVYFAAVLALPLAWTRRVAWLLAGPLVFFALGTVRLLVLALPAALVPSYASAIHAFNQLVLGVVLVGFAAVWSRRSEGEAAPRPRAAATARRGLVGLALGVGVAGVGAAWARLLLALTATVQDAAGHAGHAFVDQQSALALLPAYQLGLFAALVYASAAPSARWQPRRLALAAALLLVSQLALYLAAGELRAHLRFAIDAREVRAWSVVAPVLAAWWAGGGGLRALWPRRAAGAAPLPERV